MAIWRITQLVYVLLSLVGTGILACACVTVMNWAGVRSRGLLLLALGVKLLAAVGHVVLGFAQSVQLIAGLHFPIEVIQGGFLLLGVLGLGGDGLLLAALISLGAELRTLSRPTEAKAPLPNSPWQQ